MHVQTFTIDQQNAFQSIYWVHQNMRPNRKQYKKQYVKDRRRSSAKSKSKRSRSESPSSSDRDRSRSKSRSRSRSKDRRRSSAKSKSKSSRSDSPSSSSDRDRSCSRSRSPSKSKSKKSRKHKVKREKSSSKSPERLLLGLSSSGNTSSEASSSSSSSSCSTSPHSEILYQPVDLLMDHVVFGTARCIWIGPGKFNNREFPADTAIVTEIYLPQDWGKKSSTLKAFKVIDADNLKSITVHDAYSGPVCSFYFYIVNLS